MLFAFSDEIELTWKVRRPGMRSDLIWTSRLGVYMIRDRVFPSRDELLGWTSRQQRAPLGWYRRVVYCQEQIPHASHADQS